MRRVAAMLACGALVSLAVAAPTAAAGEPECGTTPHGATEPVKATLALAATDPETVAVALYGRKTGPRPLTLVYTVSGCKLAAGLSAPSDPPTIGPPTDNKLTTIPKGVIRLDDDPEIDGNQYVVHMQVLTSPPQYTDARLHKKFSPKFDPGTYAGFVNLKAAWMHRTATPIAISRSENRWQRVLLIALLGALGGFVFFMLLHAFSQAKLLATGWRIAIAGVLSVGIGAYVGYTTSYLNQDVWTFGANTIALLTAAFTAATSGQLVTGLLGKVYDDHTQLTETQHPVTAEEAPGSGVSGVVARLRHPGRARKAAWLKEQEKRVAV
jgi:putative flippase GtrA